MSATLTVLVIVALVLSTVALVLAIVALRRPAALQPASYSPAALIPAEPERAGGGHDGPPAVVFNPVKVARVEDFKALVTRVASEAGLPQPLFLETTRDDPGTGQAQHALAENASVVVVAGGDGTVRAVAAALAGTSTPMGLVPMGTGNLLARNLDLPLNDPREMIKVALTGRNRAMDVGWVRTELLTAEEEELALEEGTPQKVQAEDDIRQHGVQQSPPEQEHIFLVIAGMGFDANMVAGTDEDLKKRIGWAAYGVAGAKNFLGRKIEARVQIGDSLESDRLRARTIMIANCGKLPVGVTLLPDAQLDDGWLDIMALDTRGGLLGWVSLLGKIALQGVGVRRTEADPMSTIAYRRGKVIQITTAEPEAVQVDGDLVGIATHMHTRVQPAALVVRSP